MSMQTESPWTKLRNFSLYAQGARCGHVEGKGRAGSYVIGEEDEPAHAAAWVHAGTVRERCHWAAGYKHGYRLAASGESLPDELANTPPP